MKDAVLEYEVLNWQRYNPRTDAKHCTWMRLDVAILDHPDLLRLAPSGFKLCIYLLLKALRLRGKGHELLTRLTRECSIRSRDTLETYLETLQHAGIITYEIRLLSKSRPLRNETNETNETKRTRASRHKDSREVSPPTSAEARELYPSDIVDAGQSPSIDHRAAAQFLNMWNSNRGALPKVEKLNLERRRRIKTRLTQNPDLDYWVATIKRMAASDFCCSGNWATIDWLIANDTNHMKVNEGKYDNRLRANGSGGKTITTMTEEELRRMCAEADAEAAAEDAKFGITRQ